MSAYNLCNVKEQQTSQLTLGERDSQGRFAPGNRHRWVPGESGNNQGRPKGASFAGALARHALTPVSDREEMAKIAQTIGLDPEEARNIDVVAGLFYVVLCRALLRASSAGGRTDDRLVGMLQVLLKALDPSELRVSGPGGGPIPIAAVIADVQNALGMRPADALGGGAPSGLPEPGGDDPNHDHQNTD